ncbi:hypothetical protein IWQ60_001082 [Tieghemiomyces parasiticus]|uniref:Uncharacterized protein n=1 Tax=Tieghemiomyces parasiticus TaxID=78921 RepID=A0A9W8AEU9_9FUNG|nr:hypothetical protein IWQ60_001082 [Tieghemiomyces parasiticus]
MLFCFRRAGATAALLVFFSIIPTDANVPQVDSMLPSDSSTSSQRQRVTSRSNRFFERLKRFTKLGSKPAVKYYNTGVPQVTPVQFVPFSDQMYRAALHSTLNAYLALLKVNSFERRHGRSRFGHQPPTVDPPAANEVVVQYPTILSLERAPRTADTEAEPTLDPLYVNLRDNLQFPANEGLLYNFAAEETTDALYAHILNRALVDLEEKKLYGELSEGISDAARDELAPFFPSSDHPEADGPALGYVYLHLVPMTIVYYIHHGRFDVLSTLLLRTFPLEHSRRKWVLAYFQAVFLAALIPSKMDTPRMGRESGFIGTQDIKLPIARASFLTFFKSVLEFYKDRSTRDQPEYRQMEDCLPQAQKKRYQLLTYTREGKMLKGALQYPVELLTCFRAFSLDPYLFISVPMQQSLYVPIYRDEKASPMVPVKFSVLRSAQ